MKSEMTKIRLKNMKIMKKKLSYDSKSEKGDL